MNKENLEYILEREFNNRNPVIYAVNVELSNKTLPEILEKFTWLKRLILMSNKLTSQSICHFPTNLLILEIINNNLQSFDGNVLPPSLAVLNLHNNDMNEIFNLKEGIKNLNVRDNNLKTIESIPQSVKILHLENNTELKHLPNCSLNSFEYVNISNTGIKSFIDFPNDTICIEASECNFQKIVYLPSKLIKFIAHNSQISIIKSFPNSLEIIDLSDNQLKHIPTLPQYARHVDLNNNKLLIIPSISRSLEYLDLRNNTMLELAILNIYKIKFRHINILFTPTCNSITLPGNSFKNMVPQTMFKDPHQLEIQNRIVKMKPPHLLEEEDLKPIKFKNTYVV